MLAGLCPAVVTHGEGAIRSKMSPSEINQRGWSSAMTVSELPAEPV